LITGPASAKNDRNGIRKEREYTKIATGACFRSYLGPGGIYGIFKMKPTRREYDPVFVHISVFAAPHLCWELAVQSRPLVGSTARKLKTVEIIAEQRRLKLVEDRSEVF
jgi:hypothetical protein